MKTFKIVAELGNANVIALGKCGDIDKMISRWESILAEQSDPDHRAVSKDWIIQSLKTGEHHTNRKVAESVVLALTWLTATGAIGPSVIPYLRAGSTTLIVEITNIAGDTYNFRTKFDHETDRRIAL